LEAIATLVNLPELIASAIGFIIFAWILWRFMWKPVLTVIDDRRASIEHDDIAREKDKALAELRNAAIDLSFTIARRVMQEGLDRETHDRLVRGFIDELKELN
jgi:F0F1-type ATP synthase membrane subunit b/b'